MGGETCSRRQRHALAFSKEHGRRAHAPWPNQDGRRFYCVSECIVTVKTLGNRGTGVPRTTSIGGGDAAATLKCSGRGGSRCPIAIIFNDSSRRDGAIHLIRRLAPSPVRLACHLSRSDSVGINSGARLRNLLRRASVHSSERRSLQRFGRVEAASPPLIV